jgi:hypothetical protein
MTSLIPMDYIEREQIHREDRPILNEADAPFADQFSVTIDYFRVMRIPVKGGRTFSEQDNQNTPRVYHRAASWRATESLKKEFHL